MIMNRIHILLFSYSTESLTHPSCVSGSGLLHGAGAELGLLTNSELVASQAHSYTSTPESSRQWIRALSRFPGIFLPT